MTDSQRPDQDDMPDAAEVNEAVEAEQEDTVQEDDAAAPEATTADEENAEEGNAEDERLDLEAEVETVSSCERRATVTVSRDEIERYYDKEFSNLVDTAELPGFRAGHAPRKLVEKRYRKELKDQIKSQVLQDGIAQVIEDESLAAIGEPEFDFGAVELPDDGPMTFEFKLEVRPDFDLPQWKGLKLKRETREFTDKDVDEMVDRIRGDQGQLVPYDGAAEAGDYIVTSLQCLHGETVLSESDEETIRLKDTLSFHDGEISGFAEKMVGVKAGETRECELVLSDSAPNADLRGQSVKAVFTVLEVKRLELPELDAAFLEQLGVETEGDLRDAVQDNLESRFHYEQRQSIRNQVVEKLTEAADWDLPPTLLERQARRELSREVMELQRSGFSEQDIRVHENTIRRNSRARTEESLKQHFIFEKIAEEEEIDVSPRRSISRLPPSPCKSERTFAASAAGSSAKGSKTFCETRSSNERRLRRSLTTPLSKRSPTRLKKAT